MIFADIVYFGFFASLAVMRGVNFNLNQSGGIASPRVQINKGMERNEKNIWTAGV